MKKFTLAGSLLALSLVPALAQTATPAPDGQLTIGGQVRPRFEFRNGFKKPVQEGEEPAAFMEQRSRLNMAYKASAYNIKVSFQDVRIWGDVGQINKSDFLTSLHEGYGEWTPNKHVALRIGRQELVYNDSRILGNLDWAAQGRSHDAFKFIYKDSVQDLHFISTYNQDGTVQEPGKLQSPTGGDFNGTGTAAEGFKLPYPYSTQILYYKRLLGKSDFNFLAINDIIQKQVMAGSVARLTLGIDPNLVFGKFKINASAYYQLGKQSVSTDVNAYMLSLKATYTGSKKITPTIGFDMLSGDDTTSKTTNEFFDPLYGTHHAFYGLMDYFYVGNAHGARGLIDIYLKTVLDLGKAGKLNTDIHGFMSEADNYDELKFQTEAKKEEAKYLGTEVDLVWVKPITKNIKFNLGTSFMLATNGMYSVKKTSIDKVQKEYNNIGLNNWTWSMIDFTF
jgi:hypothetical protein